MIWIAVFAPLTWAYIAAALYAARNGFGLSSVMGQTTDSAEAVLVDLITACIPLLLALSLYLRHLRHRRRTARADFLQRYNKDALVKLAVNPSLIYRRHAQDLQVVWNADGPVTDGSHYPIPKGAGLLPVDQDQFLTDGTP